MKRTRSSSIIEEDIKPENKKKTTPNPKKASGHCCHIIGNYNYYHRHHLHQGTIEEPEEDFATKRKDEVLRATLNVKRKRKNVVCKRKN